VKHKFPYKWTLKDAVFTKDKGKVFSCFACGGGSTMGYKLAGFDVIGCNEIDPKMMAAYIANHHPEHSYLEPIQTFKLRTDLPDELYNLDILDGSPPCSSFSMAGNRDKDWGKDKKFREGQAKQVLDTLFFDFIDLAKKLQPKVVVAENVKGLLLAGAQKYVAEILKQFDEAGYYVDYKLLDASKMGVPQRRERVFFTAIRKDLFDGPFSDMFNTRPRLNLEFTEKTIVFSDVFISGSPERSLKGEALRLWKGRKPSDIDLENISKREGRPNFMFNHKFIKSERVSNTITGNDCCCLYEEPRYRCKSELCDCGTYPMDYDFKTSKPEYLIGMSVPPVMTAQIATRIWEQWL
jgi:DNA (cytosine-5)-methyltransferase 1